MMRRLRPWLAVLVVVAVSGTGLGARAWGQDVPFKAVVVQADAAVRAGAGPRYYLVGHLKKGQVVEVDEVIFGWNKVVPPKGSYSYISQAFVDAQGTGGVGTVNADNAKVTAGNLKGPGLSYREQLTLNKGDKVRILGQDGSFYRIAPPKDAYVFVPPGALRRAAAMQGASEAVESGKAGGTGAKAGVKTEVKVQASGGEAKGPAGGEASKAEGSAQAGAKPGQAGGQVVKKAAAGPSSGAGKTAVLKPVKPVKPVKVEAGKPELATTKPAAGVAAGVAAEKTVAKVVAKAAVKQQTAAGAAKTEASSSGGQAGTATAATTSPREMVKIETPAVSKALRAVEQRILPLFSQPVDKQPLTQMKAAYEKVLTKGSLTAFDRRLVGSRLAAIARNMRIAATLKDIQQVQREVDASAKRMARRASKPTVVKYDIVGRLEASSVYNGENLPRLFRLVDGNDNTLAYVIPSAVDAHKMLGRLVGVLGHRRYDATLKLNVFEVKRMDVLGASR